MIHNLAKNIKQSSLTGLVAYLNLPTKGKASLHHCFTSYCLTFIVTAKMMQVLFKSWNRDHNYHVNCTKHSWKSI